MFGLKLCPFTHTMRASTTTLRQPVARALLCLPILRYGALGRASAPHLGRTLLPLLATVFPPKNPEALAQRF